MNEVFHSAEDVVSYFQSFLKEYLRVKEIITPMSKDRMVGKDVDGYQDTHAYFQKLSDHYRLLLVIGTNGFNVWLNNFVPAELKEPQTKRRNKRTKQTF
jgi:hypothetical protein